jgi:predicted GNAT family N-acyltransferase
MKREIMEIEGWLTLLSIYEVESVSHFSNEYEEYNVFLREEALNYEKLNISRTHLLVDTQSGSVLAYMSLVADSVQLSKSEKELVELGLLPFSTFSAMKIGKLAVDSDAKSKYYGIGSLMIRLVRGFITNLNDNVKKTVEKKSNAVYDIFIIDWVGVFSGNKEYPKKYKY